MSTVLLVGAFGQANPGDEALCAAFCATLADHHVTIASADPAATAARHQRESVPATPRHVAAAARRADAVVVGGGTVFKQLSRSSGRPANALLRNTAALVTGTRANGARLAMIGVGAGALRGPSARSLCRWIMPRTDLVVLRDEESAGVLAGVGLRPPFWIGADPAWALFDAPHDADRTVHDKRTITIALSHHATDHTGPAHTGAAMRLDNLVGALQPMAGDWDLRLQPWQHGANNADMDLARTLQARLGRAEIIDPPTDLHDAARTFAGDALVIGMRFHSLVAAAAAGTRFVAISHEPKLAGLARRLDQASVPGHATAGVIGATIAWALANEPPTAEAVRAQLEACAHQFQMLELLLNGGAVEHPERLVALPLSNGTGAW